LFIYFANFIFSLEEQLAFLATYFDELEWEEEKSKTARLTSPTLQLYNFIHFPTLFNYLCTPKSKRIL
jgi:hypothetical protein